MNLKFVKSFFSIVLVASISFTACKTVKPVVNVVKSNSLEYIYDSLKLSEFDYKNLNIKFNAKYEKKSQTMSLKGNLKIIKDSVIWVSLSPGLGIEAVRLMCTKDSIYLLDKLNGSLTKGKYEYLKNAYKIDVDYHSLESILTNNFFVYPSTINEKKDFVSTYSISKDSIDLAVYRKNTDMVENLININRNSYKVSSYMINDVPNKRNLSVKYGYSDNKDKNSLPSTVNIKSLNADKFLFIDLEYTKIAINEDISILFKVPSDYKVIVQ
jgi:hypothetical protein